jgi:acyl-CoA thioester hydrolase
VGDWELPGPHILELAVEPRDIDVYDHVNNAVYLTWLDRVAWAHSAALGIPMEQCVARRRGMAAHKIEIEYLRAALAGDVILLGTWIVASDARLRVARRFQVRRAGDGATLARAQVDYVCINLDSGRAVRMPGDFARAYVPGAPP